MPITSTPSLGSSTNVNGGLVGPVPYYDINQTRPSPQLGAIVQTSDGYINILAQASAAISSGAECILTEPAMTMAAGAGGWFAPSGGVPINQFAWFRKQASRGSFLTSVSANALILAEGNSTVRGFATGGGATQYQVGWPPQLATKLAARSPRASAQNIFGVGSSLWTDLLARDNRMTGTGAWSQTATIGPGGNAPGATAAGSETFSPIGNVTRFDIYWRDGAVGRNFSYAVDGGAATQVNSTGTTQPAKTTVPVSLGAHTLTVSWVLGSVSILGVDAYDDTGGVPLRVWNLGISGATSTQVADNTDPQGGRRTFYTYAAADLAIIEGGIINDWRQSVPVATSKANLTTLVTVQKAAKGGTGKVLLLTPVFDNDMTNNGPIQDQYVTAMKEVAAEQGVPILDVRPTFQSWAYANSQGWMSDAVHPTQAGYAVIATLLDQAIGII